MPARTSSRIGVPRLSRTASVMAIAVLTWSRPRCTKPSLPARILARVVLPEPGGPDTNTTIGRFAFSELADTAKVYHPQGCLRFAGARASLVGPARGKG